MKITTLSSFLKVSSKDTNFPCRKAPKASHNALVLPVRVYKTS